MPLLKILETGMLFCFGFAWPFNIYKSYKARDNTGKSLLFLLVIWLGYLLGIFYKALSPNPDFVLWLYVINIIMVSIDIAFYYRNKVINKRRKEASGS
ncbi:MAG: hypothetical protein LBL09_02130 [Oscillospiraceae bacterium]|jgi:lipopolysaccharide export LptBFGC system permease protein LptF|nr:hypothetical protein [Oscillospiraceae bacterium]